MAEAVKTKPRSRVRKKQVSKTSQEAEIDKAVDALQLDVQVHGSVASANDFPKQEAKSEHAKQVVSDSHDPIVDSAITSCDKSKSADEDVDTSEKKCLLTLNKNKPMTVLKQVEKGTECNSWKHSKIPSVQQIVKSSDTQMRFEVLDVTKDLVDGGLLQQKHSSAEKSPFNSADIKYVENELQRIALDTSLQVKMSETRRTNICLSKSSIVERTKCSSKIYPTMKSQKETVFLRPLIKIELNTMKSKLEQCSRLALEDFLKNQKDIEKHELYELLQEYLSSRRELLQLQDDLRILDEDCKQKKEKLWREISETVTAKAKCDDGAPVEVSHSYVTRSFNAAVFSDMDQALKSTHNKIESLSYHSYTSELCHLQVESYIYYLLSESPRLRDIPLSEPVKAFLEHQLPISHPEEMESLRTCISILFAFQRRYISDDKFINDTRGWLSRLVAVLLRKATFSDHLFLLNHILRCPSKIKWAVCYVQPPPLSPIKDLDAQASMASRFLDHSLTVLRIILSPISEREKFLRSYKMIAKGILHSESEDEEWAVINFEDETIEELPSQQCHPDDIISLLGQLSFSALFEQILLLENASGTKFIDENQRTDKGLQKLLAFGKLILDLLTNGLQTYQSKSYGHMARRICDLIKLTILHISDVMMNSIFNNKNSSREIKRCFQEEFDVFFCHGIKCLFMYNSAVSWEFMVDLPYHCVSEDAVWNILCIFHTSFSTTKPDDNERDEENEFEIEESEAKFNDPIVRKLFQEKLCSMDDEKAFCLLLILSRIAQLRKESKFINAVTLEIFEICILHHKLAQRFFEKGKTCISDIAKTHPSIISVLLEKLKDYFLEDKDIISLFEELPLYLWHPRTEDINILCEWLLNNFFMQKNYCARLILYNMNWGLNLKGDELALSIDLHRQVALITVQAYVKYKAADSQKSLISHGIQQMFQLTSPLRRSTASSATKQDFITWVWNMLFTLRLHSLDRPHPNLQDMLSSSKTAPDICDLLQQSIEEKQPAASYVALVMTKYGHNLDLISSHGFNLISDLIRREQYAPAIHALYYVTPYLYSNPDLICNKSFMVAFQKLVTADLTYMSLTQQEPFLGQVISQLASMIKFQIIMISKIAKELACPLIKMWMQLLLKTLLTEDKQSLLVKSKGHIQVYYLLDQLVKVAFIDPYIYSYVVDNLQSFIMSIITSPTASHKKQTLFSTIWGSNKNALSLIPQLSLPSFPWFALCVFSAESDTPQSVKLWNDILKKLAVDSTVTVETALQDITASMKLPSLHLNNLPIYRWGQQIVDTSVDHPAVPLLWQRFFLYFLHRIPSEVGFPERHGVGKKLFSSSGTSKLLNALKAKLKETKSYYLQEKNRISVELTKTLDSEKKLKNFDDRNDQTSFRNQSYRVAELESSVQLFGKLINLYHTFGLWLDDPALHTATLCIPELQPEYQQELLIAVLKNDKRLWIQYVNIEQMKNKLELLKWGTCYKRTLNENEVTLILQNQLKSERHGVDEIQLDSLDKILPPPPVHLLQCPVQEVSEKTFLDMDHLLRFLEFNHKIFIEQSRIYNTEMLKLKKIDENYLCLIQEKYADKNKEISLKEVCRKGPEGTKNGCAGPASFHLKFKQKEAVERIILQIENNREQHLLLMNKLQNPSLKDLCSAATYTEKCIRMLAKKVTLLEGDPECERMKNIGVCLFYKMVDVGEETYMSSTQYHPASRFFSCCLELLGMKFIYKEVAQLIPLAVSVLKHPSIGSHLTPYFEPGCASVLKFLELYNTLVNAVDIAPPEPIFSLLSKINLNLWLEEMKANITVSQRNALIQNIGKALLKCGCKLFELERLHEPFKKHLKILTLYKFPEHYGIVLNLLLHGTDSASLNVCVWYDFFTALGCKVNESETNADVIKRALIKFAAKQRFCSDFELKETLDTLGKHFAEKRVVCPEVLQYSLYYKYQKYITPLSIFYGMIGHALIEVYSEDHSTFATEVIWKTLYSSFKPWIDPSGECDNTSFPWLPNEEGRALQIFQIFVDCLNFHYTLHKEANGNILSFALEYYINIYIVSNIRNYAINVCHTALQTLPWHDFFPSIKDMQAMCKVLDKNMPESKSFLGSVCANIPWKKVIQQVLFKQSPEKERYLHLIFQLLIKFSWEPTVVQSGSFLSVLNSLESDYSESVQCLPVSSIQQLFALYFEKCNSVCLLDKEICSTSPDIYLLRFLKIVCCMSPDHPPKLQPEIHQKRVLYVYYYVQLLSKCASEQPALLLTKCADFSNAFISVLEEVEKIIGTNSVPQEQFTEATSLLSQLLSLLNIIHEQKLQDAVLHILLKWLNGNSQSILFLPCMQVSFHCFASMYHLVAVAECCIFSYFHIAMESSSKECWKIVLSFFTEPEMTKSEFLSACIKENAHLTQCTYAKKNLSLCHVPSDKIMILESLIEWNNQAHPSINSEPKLVALWYEIIDISTELISTSEKPVVWKLLIQFCKDLNSFGRDNISGSRFSWLLGRTSSPLSVKFRFLCRALAAFLLSQLPDGGKARLKSSELGHISNNGKKSTEDIENAESAEQRITPSQQAIKAVKDLESLLTNRSYCALHSNITSALEFLYNPQHCFIHAKEFLKNLTSGIYHDVPYL